MSCLFYATPFLGECHHVQGIQLMAGGAQSQCTVDWGGALCFEKAPQVVLMPHPPSCAWMLTGLGPTRASWEAPMGRAPAEHCQPDRCRWRNRKLEILRHFPKVTRSAQAGTSIVWIENLFSFFTLCWSSLWPFLRDLEARTKWICYYSTGLFL